MSHDRRSVLTAIGLALPFGIDTRSGAAALPVGPAPVLRLRPFEEAVREAFRRPPSPEGAFAFHRIEIGHSEEVLAGVQGCHNDRPFAGYPTGHLRIVRTGSCPGSIVRGVRLYVATVDVVLTGGRTGETPSRPLDFATLPPAPVLTSGAPEDDAARPRSAIVNRERSTGRSPAAHGAR